MGPGVHRVGQQVHKRAISRTNGNPISIFGGNASQVTISGESAGGGSVMLQDIAYGGSLGSSLFVNVSLLEIRRSPRGLMFIHQTIAASPYLPMQYGYKTGCPLNPTTPSQPRLAVLRQPHMGALRRQSFLFGRQGYAYASEC